MSQTNLIGKNLEIVSAPTSSQWIDEEPLLSPLTPMIHNQGNSCSVLPSPKLSTGHQKSIFSRKASQETLAESLPGTKRKGSFEEKSPLLLPKLHYKAESMVSIGETKPTRNAEITEVEEEKDQNLLSSKGTIPNIQMQFFDFEASSDAVITEPENADIRIQSFDFFLLMK